MHAIVPRLSGTPGPAAQPGAGDRPAQPRDLLPHRLLRRAHRRARPERGHLTMAVAARPPLVADPARQRPALRGEGLHARRRRHRPRPRGLGARPGEGQRPQARARLARPRRPRRGRGAGAREQRPGPPRRRHRRLPCTPGLDGLSIPKAESAAQIHDIVAQIERLERSARPRSRAPAPVPRHRDAARLPGRRGDRPLQRPHRHHEHRRRGLLPGAGRGALGRRHRAPLPGRAPGDGLQGRSACSPRVSSAASRASATSPSSRAPPSARASSAARARAASIPTR